MEILPEFPAYITHNINVIMFWISWPLNLYEAREKKFKLYKDDFRFFKILFQGEMYITFFLKVFHFGFFFFVIHFCYKIYVQKIWTYITISVNDMTKFLSWFQEK